jgi:aryl-alcohol dehydrogenase-like predicted oxidoreductase
MILKLRPFGNTGMNVSEIGLGGWQPANPDRNLDDKEEALQIVHKSIEAGCNFFDTAQGYGYRRVRNCWTRLSTVCAIHELWMNEIAADPLPW